MLELNETNFEAAKNDEMLLVDFWAPWCGPCQRIAPIFEELSKNNAEITFAKLNIDQQSKIAQEQNVRAIPTLILYKNGVEVERIMGALPLEEYQKKIDQHV